MKKYYECHITLIAKPESKTHLEKETGWKFSIIDGDPLLGDGIKSYLTRHYPKTMSEADIIKEMKYASDICIVHGFDVLRAKIELVLYDDIK